MTLYETLKTRAQQAAQALSLPLGWEGEAFTPPQTAHVRGKLTFGESRAASLGSGGLTRTDGRMELTIVTPSGADAQAAALAASVQSCFPRGTMLDFTQGAASLGTATLGTPASAAPHSEGTHILCAVTVPFWAFSRTVLQIKE